MTIEIIVPRLGWSMEQGAFVAWLKKDGEFVRAGDLLFSIEGDKAVQEVESIDSGFLHIAPDAPKSGGSVRVGDVLGHLLAEQATADLVVPRPREPVPEVPARIERVVSSSPGFSDRQELIHGAARLPISPRALRAASELGVDWTVVKGSGRRGRIRERDILAMASNCPASANPE